jgi:hypothetical protein
VVAHLARLNEEQRELQTRLVAISLGLSAVASVFLLLVPTGSGGVEEGQIVHRTLLEVNGSGVIGLLLVPVLISVIPLLFPGRPALIVATALICGFTIVGSFSVGLFYVPASAVMLAAALRRPTQDATNRSA